MNDESIINPEPYPKIMSKRNFAKIVDMMTPEQKEEIMNMTVEVTEKINGTNFRIGHSNGIAYIGTRKHIFVERISNEFLHQEKNVPHPEWNRMTDKIKEDIRKILADMSFMHQPIQAFGELYGPGIQKGYKWHDDHTNLVMFDVKTGDHWHLKEELEDQPFSNYVEWSNVISVCKLKDALQYNIEQLTSSYSDDDFVEGVVITPTTPTPEWWPELVSARLIIKMKTKKGAEEGSRPKEKTGPKKVTFMSEYNRFVNENRINHVIQALNDNLKGTPINYEMKDLQLLIPAVIADIVMEENSNVPLSRKDTSSLYRVIPKEYAKMLDKRAEESLK